MYKKPDMLKNLMNPGGAKKTGSNANTLNDEDENEASEGADL